MEAQRVELATAHNLSMEEGDLNPVWVVPKPTVYHWGHYPESSLPMDKLEALGGQGFVRTPQRVPGNLHPCMELPGKVPSPLEPQFPNL